MRPANEFEYGYKAVAVTRRDPALCFKIAPDAYAAASNNPRGFQIHYVRSYCFHRVAMFRRDPALCDEVRPLSTGFLDGSAINAEACRAHATTTPAPKYGSGGGKRELFLRLLGYIEPSFSGSYVEISDLYEQEVRSGGFGKRAERLPDFSQGDDLAREQLSELAPACDSPNGSRLCRLLECALMRDGDQRAECIGRLQRPPI